MALRSMFRTTMSPEQRACCADTWARAFMDEPIGVLPSCLAKGASCPMKAPGQPLDRVSEIDWSLVWSAVIIAAAVAFGVVKLLCVLVRGIGEGRPWPWLYQLRRASVRMLQHALHVAESIVRTALRLAWLGGGYTLLVVFEVVTLVTVAAMIAYPYLKEKDQKSLRAAAFGLADLATGHMSLDPTMLAVGVYTTCVLYVLLGSLERRFRAPVIRFLLANYIGVTVAAPAAGVAADFGRAIFK